MAARFTRRSFLRGMGGAGAALALGPLLPIFESRADTATSPKRLVIFATNTGMTGRYPDNWRPGGTGANFTFPAGSILQPLARHRDRLLILQGVDMLSYKDSPSVGGHPTGMVNMLTASPGQEGDLFGGGGKDRGGWNSGVSVDQFVASRFERETTYRSVEFGVAVTGGEHLRNRMSYRGIAQPVPPENSPYAVFDRIFAPLAGGVEELERIRAQKRSVLDRVCADLETLRGRISKADRDKLDAHLTACRDVEQRLQRPAQICEAPALGGQMNVTAEANIPAIADLHLRLMVRLLACDTTRVTSILWGSAPIEWRFGWLGTPLTSSFHGLSHAPASDAAAQDQMQAAERWFASQFANLLDLMSEVQEGDGTMLDNSVVVWCTENGRSNNHDYRNMPYVIAGSGGGHFRTGRFLDLGGGIPHNRLWVSVCNAVGLTDVNEFGSTRYAQGALTELRG